MASGQQPELLLSIHASLMYSLLLLLLTLQVPPCPPSEALFAQSWNKIIDDLRQRDLINHQERERLSYLEVCSAATNEHGGWWLLPRWAPDTCLVSDLWLVEQTLLLC